MGLSRYPHVLIQDSCCFSDPEGFLYHLTVLLLSLSVTLKCEVRTIIVVLRRLKCIIIDDVRNVCALALHYFNTQPWFHS